MTGRAAKGGASATGRAGRRRQPTTDEELALLNLVAGEGVRWRERHGGRWQHGTVGRRERDGSIGVTDASGAARSIGVERLQVAARGARGGRTWEPLPARAGRCEQLSLLSPADLAAVAPAGP